MADGKPGLLARAQQAEQRGNREGRDLWDRYRTHRERITAEILALAPQAGGRLCLLGAGNANDYDLDRLAERFSEIHLVDIDGSALSRALGRQSAEVRARLRCHAPVDVSGLYRQLEAQRRLDADALAATGAAEVLGQLPGDFDVVASCCVLSQISWALQSLLPSGAPPLPVLEQAVVTVHLCTLVGLLRPAGAALLVSDLVSSDAYPLLEQLPPDEDLSALVQRLATERVAHTVSNPELIKQTLRRDRPLTAAIEPPQVGQPWLWTGSKSLTYLVYPMLLRKRP